MIRKWFYICSMAGVTMLEYKKKTHTIVIVPVLLRQTAAGSWNSRSFLLQPFSMSQISISLLNEMLIYGLSQSYDAVSSIVHGAT